MFYFSYSARIKGAKQSIDKFLSLTYAFGNTPPEDGWLDFAEIFDAKVHPADDGDVYVDIDCGNSKGPWSELLDGKPYNGHGRLGFLPVSEELGLTSEFYIYSDESSTHLIFENGYEVFCEESEVHDLVWEDGVYKTFDEWGAAYGVPEGTTLRDVLAGENQAYGEELYDIDMTWEDFVKHMEPYDGEYFHFGGLPIEWHI